MIAKGRAHTPPVTTSAAPASHQGSSAPHRTLVLRTLARVGGYEAQAASLVPRQGRRSIEQSCVREGVQRKPGVVGQLTFGRGRGDRAPRAQRGCRRRVQRLESSSGPSGLASVGELRLGGPLAGDTEPELVGRVRAALATGDHAALDALRDERHAAPASAPSVASLADTHVAVALSDLQAVFVERHDDFTRVADALLDDVAAVVAARLAGGLVTAEDFAEAAVDLTAVTESYRRYADLVVTDAVDPDLTRRHEGGLGFLQASRLLRSAARNPRRLDDATLDLLDRALGADLAAFAASGKGVPERAARVLVAVLLERQRTSAMLEDPSFSQLGHLYDRAFAFHGLPYRSELFRTFLHDRYLTAMTAIAADEAALAGLRDSLVSEVADYVARLSADNGGPLTRSHRRRLSEIFSERNPETDGHHVDVVLDAHLAEVEAELARRCAEREARVETESEHADPNDEAATTPETSPEPVRAPADDDEARRIEAERKRRLDETYRFASGLEPHSMSYVRDWLCAMADDVEQATARYPFTPAHVQFALTQVCDLERLPAVAAGVARFQEAGRTIALELHDIAFELAVATVALNDRRARQPVASSDADPGEQRAPAKVAIVVPLLLDLAMYQALEQVAEGRSGVVPAAADYARFELESYRDRIRVLQRALNVALDALDTLSAAAWDGGAEGPIETVADYPSVADYLRAQFADTWGAEFTALHEEAFSTHPFPLPGDPALARAEWLHARASWLVRIGQHAHEELAERRRLTVETRTHQALAELLPAYLERLARGEHLQAGVLWDEVRARLYLPSDLQRADSAAARARLNAELAIARGVVLEAAEAGNRQQFMTLLVQMEESLVDADPATAAVVFRELERFARTDRRSGRAAIARDDMAMAEAAKSLGRQLVTAHAARYLTLYERAQIALDASGHELAIGCTAERVAETATVLSDILASGAALTVAEAVAFAGAHRGDIVQAHLESKAGLPPEQRSSAVAGSDLALTFIARSAETGVLSVILSAEAEGGVGAETRLVGLARSCREAGAEGRQVAKYITLVVLGTDALIEPTDADMPEGAWDAERIREQARRRKERAIVRLDAGFHPDEREEVPLEGSDDSDSRPRRLSAAEREAWEIYAGISGDGDLLGWGEEEWDTTGAILEMIAQTLVISFLTGGAGGIVAGILNLGRAGAFIIGTVLFTTVVRELQRAETGEEPPLDFWTDLALNLAGGWLAGRLTAGFTRGFKASQSAVRRAAIGGGVMAIDYGVNVATDLAYQYLASEDRELGAEAIQTALITNLGFAVCMKAAGTMGRKATDRVRGHFADDRAADPALHAALERVRGYDDAMTAYTMRARSAGDPDVQVRCAEAVRDAAAAKARVLTAQRHARLKSLGAELEATLPLLDADIERARAMLEIGARPTEHGAGFTYRAGEGNAEVLRRMLVETDASFATRWTPDGFRFVVETDEGPLGYAPERRAEGHGRAAAAETPVRRSSRTRRQLEADADAPRRADESEAEAEVRRRGARHELSAYDMQLQGVVGRELGLLRTERDEVDRGVLQARGRFLAWCLDHDPTTLAGAARLFAQPDFYRTVKAAQLGEPLRRVLDAHRFEMIQSARERTVASLYADFGESCFIGVLNTGSAALQQPGKYTPFLKDVDFSWVAVAHEGSTVDTDTVVAQAARRFRDSFIADFGFAPEVIDVHSFPLMRFVESAGPDELHDVIVHNWRTQRMLRSNPEAYHQPGALKQGLHQYNYEVGTLETFERGAAGDVRQVHQGQMGAQQVIRNVLGISEPGRGDAFGAVMGNREFFEHHLGHSDPTPHLYEASKYFERGYAGFLLLDGDVPDNVPRPDGVASLVALSRHIKDNSLKGQAAVEYLRSRGRDPGAYIAALKVHFDYFEQVSFVAKLDDLMTRIDLPAETPSQSIVAEVVRALDSQALRQTLGALEPDRLAGLQRAMDAVGPERWSRLMRRHGSDDAATFTTRLHEDGALQLGRDVAELLTDVERAALRDGDRSHPLYERLTSGEVWERLSAAGVTTADITPFIDDVNGHFANGRLRALTALSRELFEAWQLLRSSDQHQ